MDKSIAEGKEKQVEINDAKASLKDLRDAKDKTKKARDIARQLGAMKNDDAASVEKVKKAAAEALTLAQTDEANAQKKFTTLDTQVADIAKKLKYQQSVEDNMDTEDKQYKAKKAKNDKLVKKFGRDLKKAQAAQTIAKKLQDNATHARMQAQEAVDLIQKKSDFLGKTPEQLYAESQAEAKAVEEREKKRAEEGDKAAKLLAEVEEKAAAQAKAAKERAAKEKYQKELDEARAAADAAFVTLDKTS